MIHVNDTKEKKVASVLVTSANLGSSVAIIRALGRAGYRVLAADSTSRSLGFYSRFAHKKVVYPSPEAHPQLFVEFLLEVFEREKVDLLIPVTDLEIHPVVNYRQLFDSVVKVALPKNDLIDITNDKAKTIQLAKKVGVPVPETCFARTSEEALNFARNLKWPVVVKPQFSKKIIQGKGIASFEISYANSPKDLFRLMQAIEKKCTVILQPYHQGDGYGIEMLACEGKLIAAFAHKRLREIPITGGASCYRKSIKLGSKLFSYALRLLSEIRWTGLAMVEFKVKGSDAILMEINGRVWGSLPLAVASGVNFPLLLTKLFLNKKRDIKVVPPNKYKIGVHCSNLGKELMWIAMVLMQRKKYSFLPMPKRSQAVRAILSLFNPSNKLDLFCLDDPIPGLLELPWIVRKFDQKLKMSSQPGV